MNISKISLYLKRIPLNKDHDMIENYAKVMLKKKDIWRFKHEIQAEFCKSVVLRTMKEVKVDKKFIVAVFWNDEENQRSEKELAHRHLRPRQIAENHVM